MNKLEKNEHGEWLVGRRIKYNSSSGSFYIHSRGECVYNLYVDEIQQMIEILAREKKLELVLVLGGEEQFNNGCLSLMPKVKWR